MSSNYCIGGCHQLLILENNICGVRDYSIVVQHRANTFLKYPSP